MSNNETRHDLYRSVDWLEFNKALTQYRHYAFTVIISHTTFNILYKGHSTFADDRTIYFGSALHYIHL